MIRNLALLALAGWLLPVSSSAQQRLDEIIFRQNRPLFFQEVNWIRPDSGNGLVSYHFRISNDYLAFVNTTGPDQTPVYQAKIRLNIQIKGTDSSFYNFSEDFSEVVSTIRDSQNRYQFLTGSIQFPATSRPAVVNLEVTDLNNNKQIFPSTIRKVIRQQKTTSVDNVWILEDDSTWYKPVNFEKSVVLGKPAYLFLSVSDSLNLRNWKVGLLHKLPGEKEYASVDSMMNLQFNPLETKTIRLNEKNRVKVTGVRAGLDFSKLDAGQYGLTIGPTAADTIFFNVNWLYMPFSLYDLDVATRVLKYLVSDKVYDDLSSGSAKKRISAFRKFWKERDPSPGTTYNELLHEYYRRVDYTWANFGTSRNPGWRTDRGKVYILNGAPKTQKKETPPNQPPREIWDYSTPGKRFVFVDLSGKGDYTLQKTGP